MGDKNVVQVHPVIAGMPDLPQNRIAAPAIHQEGLSALLQQKASIITLRHKRIARAQHRQLQGRQGTVLCLPCLLVFLLYLVL